MKHMDIKELIDNSLKKIFSLIGIKPDYTVEVDEDEVYNVKISGENLNFLIGFRGQSLEALQTLLKLIVYRKTEQQIVLSVDINSYKDQKSEKLQEMARGFIDKVRFFEKEIELPFMNPWERRQIHMFVAEYEDITSESTGEGDNRRVVLKPKKAGSKKKEK
jgi:spoIIIJ-associated protein